MYGERANCDLYIATFSCSIALCKIIILYNRLLLIFVEDTNVIHYYRNYRILSSNPARNMDVCSRFSVLCCPYDGPMPCPRSPINMYNEEIYSFQSLILNWKRSKDLIHET
jgi:hypothetical protein